MKLELKKFHQRRRFFMVLPWLVLPFLSMIFWALGGGKGLPAQAQTPSQAGLNATLPDPHFDETEPWDKLSLYEFAERDSIIYKQARERDPYFDLVKVKTAQDNPAAATDSSGRSSMITTFPTKETQRVDANELRVNQKLEELYREINKPSTPKEIQTGKFDQMPLPTRDAQFSSDVDRLEQMMEMMKESPEPDPEMKQIEDVLEKILDIQHPERVKERLKNSTYVNQTSRSVKLASTEDDVSLLGTVSKSRSLTDSTSVLSTGHLSNYATNGFFGLDDSPIEQVDGNAIEAIVHDTQEIVDGSTIKIRLMQAIAIDGAAIQKDQFVYGRCSIKGERLTIEINSVRTGDALFPVTLMAYDLDGLEGIYIPGAIARDAAKQASDNALQNIQVMSLDPSIGAQAAAAGLEATKGLFSKKAKQVKVKVKAGYHILLKNATASTI